jgi:sulfite reductase (ferredoxin)
MPDLRFKSEPPRHTDVPRPRRAEGQWSFGYTEPLNKNEQSKKDDDPLNVQARILHIYSKRGFASIDPADLRGRFRWLGLYTQRAPGFDGGKTAMLEEEELDDEFFMMRVRTDGALMPAATVRALGTIGQEFARDTADVTDRENIQYHWIRVEDVPEIWSRLEAAGLSTMEACGDSPRPFLGSPVAGVAKDEIIDGTSALDEIKRRYLGNPEFSNFPRKFKTALTGHPGHDVSPETNDVAFVGTVHPEHGPGFDLWVGGGLSTNPMLAQRLGVWIPLEEVADAWEGVAGIFRDYGYRRPTGASTSSARSWRASTSTVSSWTAPPPPRPRSPVTTSACTGRRTATSTSAPLPSSGGSRGPCCPASATSSRSTTPAASGSRPTRSWSSWA